MRTFFAMFMKDYFYSEIRGLKLLSDFITIKQYCNVDFVMKNELLSQERKKQIRNEISECISKMKSGNYNLIILDKVIVSIFFNLLEVKDLLEVTNQKPADVELIYTGRYCPQ
jgi:cob(I)alamin adenosyltransferase